jgi:hypothetical protein
MNQLCITKYKEEQAGIKAGHGFQRAASAAPEKQPV